MSLGLLAAIIGAAAYNFTRKLMLWGALALVLFGLLRTGRFDWSLGWLAAGLEATPVLRTVLELLQYFSLALAAERIWPDFVLAAGAGLAIDLVLVVSVFALDVLQLEAAAMAGERLYAQAQRIRRGGAAAAVLGGSDKRRFSLPSLPWLAGAGPIAWRHLTAIPRSRSSVAVILLFVPLLVMALVRSGNVEPGSSPPLGLALGIQVFAMTFVLTPLVAYDFRGDLEQVDVLKSLPLASWALAVGELLTPVLLLTLIQWIDLAVMAVSLGRPGFTRVALVGGVFCVPFNLFLVGLDNLLFLLFPTRMVATVGDFQVYGRQILLQVAKLFCLTVAGGICGGFAVTAYFLLGRSVVAGGLVGGTVMMGFGIGLVPLISMAFRRFDVSRDMPV